MPQFSVSFVGVEQSGLSDDQLSQITDHTLAAATLWGRYIDAPDVTLDIEFDVGAVGTGRAAGTSTSFVYLETTEEGVDIFDYSAPYKLRTGIDENGAASDLRVIIDPETLGQYSFEEDPFNPSDSSLDLGLTDFLSLVVHELGHGLGFNGFAVAEPITSIPDLPQQSVFDNLIAIENDVVVFTGERATEVAGRSIEFSGSISASFVTNEVARAEYHIGNLPEQFSDLTPLAGLGSDLGSAALAGFFLLFGARYYPTAIDVAILEDIGVPIKSASDDDDDLYGFEAPDPRFESFYQVPNAPFLLGQDTLRGGDGDDTLHGLSGDDTLRGENGHDRLIAGKGNDFIAGGAGQDIAEGGDGNDEIFAGGPESGNDIFIGGRGSDTVGGGDGDDLIIGDLAHSDALTLSFPNNDLISISNDHNTLFGGDGNDTLIGSDFSDENENGQYDDGEGYLFDNGNHILFAGTGNDILIGSAGDDIAGGGPGDDTILTGDGRDILYGGQDRGDTGTNDVLLAGNGDDLVFAAAGDDFLDGSHGNDELFGGAGDDTIIGGEGADTLYSGMGDDTVTGGEGVDRFVFNTTSGQDTVTDFDPAEDILALAGTAAFNTFSAVLAASHQSDVGLVISFGNNSVTLVDITADDLTAENVVI